jgi:DNA-binding transcriptional regulator PaaX
MCFNDKVWITPDPVADATLPLNRLRLEPNALVVVEARPAPPVSDAHLANSAWNFKEINDRYRVVLDLTARGEQLARQAAAKPLEFGQWLAAERAAWSDALSLEPLLPEGLLPTGYLGREAWSQRQAAYAAVAKRGLEWSK